jgi:DNA modification methylase
METTHRVHVADARSMDALADESVELIVTSPPYPMVEMWDDLFADLDPAVAERLSAGDGRAAFRLMHEVLDAVWAEVARVLAPGGVAAVNVVDAPRRVDDRFRLYSNHAEFIRRLTDQGLDPLPDVIWRKPANSSNAFMGSARPTNAYVTLEHEYVLLFRKGGPRSFDGEPRSESALFWEERNQWFSDVWDDVRGVGQALDDADGLRDKSAAYPFEIPYRLICMYSVYDDTVLDPFWGTGTTSLAAMVAGRNSVGYELDGELLPAFDRAAGDVPELSRSVVDERLDAHREFVARRRADGDPPAHEATHYDFPVVMSQERDLTFYEVEDVDATPETATGGPREYVATHRPYVE